MEALREQQAAWVELWLVHGAAAASTRAPVLLPRSHGSHRGGGALPADDTPGLESQTHTSSLLSGQQQRWGVRGRDSVPL